MLSEQKSPDHLAYRPEMSLTWQEMIAEKKALEPAEILHHLEVAQGYLRNTPGPHQAERQALEPEWLGWWIKFFKDFGNESRSEPVGRTFLSLSEVAEQNTIQNELGITTATFFANCHEGTRAHRVVTAYMLSVLRNGFVGIFLDESISPGKERASSYLPLSLRMSMWAHYFSYDEIYGRRINYLRYISIIPDKPSNVGVNEYYDSIFLASEARRFFVMKGDPHFVEKYQRNFMHPTLIPITRPLMVVKPELCHIDENDVFTFDMVDTPSTTSRVRRLFPENEMKL